MAGSAVDWADQPTIFKIVAANFWVRFVAACRVGGFRGGSPAPVELGPGFIEEASAALAEVQTDEAMLADQFWQEVERDANGRPYVDL